MPANDIRSLTDILEAAAGAAGNDSLVYEQLSVMDLLHQGELHFAFQRNFGALFHIVQDILQVRVAFLDRIYVARMERHGDHWTDLVELDPDTAVVIRSRFRSEHGVVFRPSVCFIPSFCDFIGLPDGGKAGRLRGHDIDPDAEIRREIGYARPHKFHDLVFDIAFFKHGADDGQRHILRADAGQRLSGHIDSDHFRQRNVIGFVQQLFDQLRTALAHGHGAERTVPGV